MQNKTLKAVCTLAVLLVFSTALFGQTARKRFHKKLDFHRNDELILSNTNGSVEIDSWDQDKIDISADIKVKGRSYSDAREFLEKVEILVDQRGNTTEVESDYPRKRGGKNSSIWDILTNNNRISVSISYRIKIPQKADVDVHTTNGGISIDAILGEIDTYSTNGNITVENSQGMVNSQTTNGSIEVELRKAEEFKKMDFSTTNGSIRVYLPKDINADIEARTTNGRVYSDFDLNVRGRSHKRQLYGYINEGGCPIRLKTTNGSIYIREY